MFLAALGLLEVPLGTGVGRGWSLPALPSLQSPGLGLVPSERQVWGEKKWAVGECFSYLEMQQVAWAAAWLAAGAVKRCFSALDSPIRIYLYIKI